MSEKPTTAPVDQRSALTKEDVNQIAQAYAKLKSLGSSIIVNPATDTERKALTKYLGDSFAKYGSEFLGCWFTLHNEYEPLLGVLATFLDRVADVQAHKAQMLADARAEYAKNNPTAP